jgi:hypothetical protein
LTFDVTTFAREMLMRAIEWKAGFQMIEIGGARACAQHQQ